MGEKIPFRKKAPNKDLVRLAELLRRNSDGTLLRWRREVRRLPAAQKLDVPTLNDHVPSVLAELADALAQGHTASVMDLQLQNSPKIHGTERFRAGFDIVEVVAEYNILQEVIQTLAEDNAVDISGEVSRIINRVFDRAIAAAVDTYARQKTLEVEQRREEHLSFVMHDLKTPLAAMQTARLLLENSLPANVKTGRVANMLELLERNARRLHSLLKMASQEQYNIAISTTGEMRVERREFDLWPLVEGLIRDLQPLSEQSPVQIINAVPDDLTIFADAILMTQVFQNLLSNAIRYTTRGQVVVGGEKRDEERLVRCWVRDTGTGISSERLPRVFDKLETDPQHKGGLGLGLVIVKQVVEAHGGQVFVESTPDVGSTFSFTLPSSSPGRN